MTTALYLNDQPVEKLFRGGQAVQRVYRGADQVWPFEEWMLFRDNQRGFLSRLSDTTTLYQDSAGTTPVTGPGQQIGLPLDTRLWGGKTLEQVLAGQTNRRAAGIGTDADTGTGVSTDDGTSVTLVGTDADNRARRTWEVTGLVVNDFYELEFEVTNYVSGGAFIGMFNSVTTTARTAVADGVGTFRGVFQTPATTRVLTLSTPAGGGNMTIANESIKVRHLPGNHAPQSTSAARSTLGREPFGGRRNLLTYTEDFSNAAWNKIGSTSLDDLGGGEWRINNLGDAAGVRMHQWVSASPLSTWTGGIEVKGEGSDIGKTIRLLLIRYINGSSVTEEVNHTLTGDWVRINPTLTLLADNNAIDFRIVRGADDYANSALIRRPQLELGSTATPYQKVVSQFDVTEAGVPDVWYLAYDFVDDVLPIPFASNFTGDVVVCGTGGSWIERDVTITGGNNLNIGITGIAGRTPGIMQAIGKVVGIVTREGTFTDKELSLIIKANKAKGAKGLLVAGDELVNNHDFAAGSTGWSTTSGVSISDGSAIWDNADNGSGIQQASPAGDINPNAFFDVEVDVDGYTSGQLRSRLGSAGTHKLLRNSIGLDRFIYASPSEITNHPIQLLCSGMTTASIGSISIKELRPQEDW